MGQIVPLCLLMWKMTENMEEIKILQATFHILYAIMYEDLNEHLSNTGNRKIHIQYHNIPETNVPFSFH